MASPWPPGFERIPDEDWTRQPVQELARAYDTVEQHGWYDNLDHTADQVNAFLDEGDILLDYSGGTGILVDRLLKRGLGEIGVLNVDSSPKFLRLCLEKFRQEERVAMRRIPYLQEESRLAYVDEVLDDVILDRGVDAVTSTNAIHLYHGLVETLASWARVMKPAGRAFVQSGNIDRGGRPEDRWIIDRTIEAISDEARSIVRSRPRFQPYRSRLDDEAWMAAHGDYRDKVFPPIRGLEHYESAFDEAGFDVLETEHRPIKARVDEWVAFLSAYDDAVVGWIGGAEKVTDVEPPEEAVEDRRALLEDAAERVFGGDVFEAEWTYWTLAPR